MGLPRRRKGGGSLRATEYVIRLAPSAPRPPTRVTDRRCASPALLLSEKRGPHRSIVSILGGHETPAPEYLLYVGRGGDVNARTRIPCGFPGKFDSPALHRGFSRYTVGGVKSGKCFVCVGCRLRRRVVAAYGNQLFFRTGSRYLG